MVRDYSQRRTVSKNRPKKQPVSLLIPLVAVAVVIAFSGGLFTGWILFHDRDTALTEQSAGQAPAPMPQAATPATAAPGSDQSLTFYETLSKGHGNSIIGSGINQVVPVQPATAKSDASTSPAPVAAEQKLVKPPAPQKGIETGTAPSSTAQPVPTPVKDSVKPVEKGKTVEQPKPDKETFVVQVGSYKNRAEAEEMVVRSKGAGLPAYMVEARTDKGTWYRVRIGKKLDQEAANKLAAKAGKGAIAVPE